MENKNRFIIFSTVIIVLIIISFSSLMITANDNISKDTNYKKINNTNQINYASNKKENKKIRILIDPGHNAATKGAVGFLGYEYYMTLRLAKQLTAILDKDNRFEYTLSRTGAYYDKPIKEYITNNYQKLLGIYNTELEKTERTGNLTRYQTMEIYAIRHYAIDNNFDALISLHFDYMPYIKQREKTEGFHIIVSPYNGEFQTSMKIANKISERMQESYKISPVIATDNILPDNVWKFYNKEDLLNKGIALRGLVLLGDSFEYEYNKQTFKKDIPSVMVESGFMHDWRLGSTKELSNISDKIYKALVDVYCN